MESTLAPSVTLRQVVEDRAISLCSLAFLSPTPERKGRDVHRVFTTVSPTLGPGQAQRGHLLNKLMNETKKE